MNFIGNTRQFKIFLNGKGIDINHSYQCQQNYISIPIHQLLVMYFSFPDGTFGGNISCCRMTLMAVLRTVLA